MTESPSPHDELISRVLDGDATDEERARVAREPALQARLRAFERVRHALADVEPASETSRNAAIAAALSAGTASIDRPFVAHERERRRRRLVTIVGVAAAIVIGVPLLAIALTGHGSEQKSASTGSVESAAVGPSETLAESTGTDDFGTDLGTIDSDEQLRAAVAAWSAQASADVRLQTPVTPAVQASSGLFDPSQDVVCSSVELARDPSLGVATFAATATWKAIPAIVVVYRGEADVIVVMRDDCSVVTRVPA